MCNRYVLIKMCILMLNNKMKLKDELYFNMLVFMCWLYDVMI